MTTFRNKETGEFKTLEGDWEILKENLYRVTVEVLIAIPQDEDLPGMIEDTVSAIFTENLEAQGIIVDWRYFSPTSTADPEEWDYDS